MKRYIQPTIEIIRVEKETLMCSSFDGHRDGDKGCNKGDDWHWHGWGPRKTNLWDNNEENNGK